jgi:hypothetical protein
MTSPGDVIGAGIGVAALGLATAGVQKLRARYSVNPLWQTRLASVWSYGLAGVLFFGGLSATAVGIILWAGHG